MKIEVVTDIVCPWCWLGKRRLELALEQRPDLEIDITWLPFELNPDLPADGVGRAEFLARRFPDAAELAARQAALGRHGREIGIGFRFDRIERMPNTRAAHALVLYAAQAGCADAVLEALFNAYFAEGCDVGDPRVLAELAAQCGLDPQAIAARLAGRDEFDRIAALEESIHGAGVTGVPHYVFGGRFAFSGAQDVAMFCRALDAVAA